MFGSISDYAARTLSKRELEKEFSDQDDQIAKDIRYNLARSYEEDGNAEQALNLYRKLAQLDFAYKDVSQRVNKLRNAKTE